MACGVRIGGYGLVSAYGTGTEVMLEALRAGREGVAPLRAFAPPYREHFPVNPIDRARFPASVEGAVVMLSAAAREAIARGGLDPHAPLGDCALVLGSSNGLLYVGEEECRAQLRASGRHDLPIHPLGRLARHLARALGIGGPVLTLSTACSSSANAALVGADLIRRGVARRALALGFEALSAVSLGGFYALLLLDPEGCRPFDRHRRGLQLGEGAGALLLEAGEGGTQLAGGANLCDTHHMTSAGPGGRAMARVIAAALTTAGVRAEDIVAVKAHGVGSLDSDAAEAAALQAVFGGRPPPITALKRYFGHTLGACGAIETAALLSCLEAGFLPPAAGFREPDPALGITPLTAPRVAVAGYYLLNFFGFGGNYAALVIRHG